MRTISEELGAIKELNRTVNPKAAEAAMYKLLARLRPEELNGAQREIADVIADFLPKRRRALSAAFQRRSVLLTPSQRSSPQAGRPIPSQVTTTLPSSRTNAGSPQHTSRKTPEKQATATRPRDTTLLELRARLSELGNNYIFQWSTWYRDLISEVFDYSLPRMKSVTDGQVLLSHLEDEFARHSAAIFRKGFEFKCRTTRPEVAVTVSLTGLQRLLDIPLEFYAAALATTSNADLICAARLVCSGILVGVLQGFGSIPFGDKSGWQCLSKQPELWAHCLAFLTPGHLDQVVSRLVQGDLRDGLRNVLMPVVKALDEVIALAPEGQALLPGMSQFSRDTWRIDIALELPRSIEGRRYLDVHCYLLSGEIGRLHLQESAGSGAVLIVISGRADIQDWIETHDRLRTLVVEAKNDADATTAEASAILMRAVTDLAGVTTWNTPLTHNCARDFPLNQPRLQKYFRVHRRSIRDLLRSFERGTGIRLWCSVRRSGKTTAGFDLSSSTGTAAVITQTCEPIGQHPDEDLFINAFRAALDSGERLPKTFFQDVVASCTRDQKDSASKIVFVVDEYETLFHELLLAVEHDGRARYRLVQPLLNQMVAFSRENLLLLIGMQPDAHFILMDQNQLSSYVRQDAFPLFTYADSEGESEFVMLLRKILGNHVRADPSFTALLHGETGGHPFLTVNLLADLFDWLISKRRPAAGLTLTDEDFVCFATARLAPEAIRQCKEYEFFRSFLRNTLDRGVATQHPWLYAICCTLRNIALNSPSSLSCSIVEFRDLLARTQPADSPIDADDLLRTSQQANFLILDGETVRPRIPLMARIASTVRPPIRA